MTVQAISTRRLRDINFKYFNIVIHVMQRELSDRHEIYELIDLLRKINWYSFRLENTQIE